MDATLLPTGSDEGPVVSEAEKAERRERYLTHVLELKEAEKAYQEVIKQNKVMIKEIKAGYARARGKAEDLVMNLGEILADDGSVISLMNLMGSTEFGDEFYYHSMNACILSLMIAQEFDYPKDATKMIGLGALFHDIGELEEATKMIGKGITSRHEELRIRRSHPQNGVKLQIRQIGLPRLLSPRINLRRQAKSPNPPSNPRSLSDISVRDEASEVRAGARPQAPKNRRRIHWNALRVFRGPRTKQMPVHRSPQ